jgi:hypothetical protein
MSVQGVGCLLCFAPEPNMILEMTATFLGEDVCGPWALGQIIGVTSNRIVRSV